MLDALLGDSTMIQLQGKNNSATIVFSVLFWIDQVLFGLPCAFFGIDLLIKGTAEGLVAVIALFLAWIGGTLTWGFAALMYRLPFYELPVSQIAKSIAQQNLSQKSADVENAIAEAVHSMEEVRGTKWT